MDADSRTTALADYFRAVEELGIRDESTRQAVARLLMGRTADPEPDQPRPLPVDDSSDDFQEPEPSPQPQTPGIPSLETVASSEEALQSKLTAIESDADAEMPTGYDLSDFIPPLTADRNTNSTLAFTSLFAPPGRRAILSRTLSSRIASAEPDVEEIIRRSAQAIPLERLPMLVRLSLNRGTQILIDLGAGMAPFAVDRARIVGEIRDLAGNVERLRFRNSPLDGVMADGSAKFRPWQVPAPRIPILIVSDLGMNRWSPDAKPDAAARWIEFARLAAENGCPVLALVPVDRVDWLPALARHIHMILWDRETSARSVFAATSLHRPSLRPRDLLPLKRTLSLAVRVEPELLRAVRVKLFPALGVGAEAMLWEDADVETRNATGIVFRPDRRQNFQSALAADPELLETAWEIIEPLHRSISPAIRMEEELAYASLSSAPGSQQRAAEITRRIVATLATDQRETFSRWALHAALRMTSDLKTTREGIHLQQGVAARNPDLAAELLSEIPERDRDIPAWLRPAQMPDPMQIGVRLVRNGLEIGPPSLPDSRTLTIPQARQPWLDLAPVFPIDYAPQPFRRAHFKLPEGGRFFLEAPEGLLLRTSDGRRFQLTPVVPAPTFSEAYHISPGRGSQSTPAEIGRRRAMIVWNENSPDPFLKPFADWKPYLDDIRRTLVDPESGGFDKCEVVGTTESTQRQLEQFYSEAGPDDATLLIYANSATPADGGEPLLLSNASSPYQWLPLAWLRDRMMESVASTHAVILDCVRVDIASRVANGEPDLQIGEHPVEWLIHHRRTPYQLLTRTPVSEFDAFPRALLDALRLGAADSNQDGHVSMSELREFIQRRISEGRKVSDTLEAHSSGDTFRLAKASVCGLVYDIFVSSSVASEETDPHQEIIRNFLAALRGHADEIIGRPDALKIRLNEHIQPGENFDSPMPACGIFLALISDKHPRSKRLNDELNQFTVGLEPNETNESRIVRYNIGSASEQSLAFPGDPSIFKTWLNAENFDAEARTTAEFIVSLLSTLRGELRNPESGESASAIPDKER